MNAATEGTVGGIPRNEVIVSFADGASARGTVMGFNPQRASFFLHSDQPVDEATSREIAFGGVKTIAFLPSRSAQKREMTFPPTARLVTVRFMDGETLRGITQSYAGVRVGLFLVPTAGEEVERFFIPVAAIREVVSVKRLGEILTEQGMVTPAKVEAAMKKQEELRNEPIGQILLKQRIITDQQLAQGLSLQQKRSGKKLGEILLEQNFIDQAQLKEALGSQQSQRGKKIGQIMVEMGYATYKMIGIALAIQYNVPFLDLSSQAVDPKLRELVPAESARRWNVMPLNLQQNVLTIAVIDPAEHGAEDDLRTRTSFTVIVVVATPQDIARAIATYYGT
jgi:hypothetical protein